MPPGRSSRPPGPRSRSSSRASLVNSGGAPLPYGSHVASPLRSGAPVKVAVVGVGYWGPNIVRNLQHVDVCEGVVAFDLDESRLKGISRHYPSTTLAGDLDQILRDPDIGAVVVATPVVTHADVARQVLEAGKSVLVEKPLA